MTSAGARAEIERRAAAAALAGASLGALPLLWLIREALDDYVSFNEAADADYWIVQQPTETWLLHTGGHDLWLDPWNGKRILVERDAFGSAVRSHEVPNAALVLYDAVKDDPVRAARLLVAIESARKGAR